MKRSKKNNETVIIEKIKYAQQLPENEAVATLLDCLKHGGQLAAQKAVCALGEIDHCSVITSLLEAYNWAEEDPQERDRDYSTRQAIVAVLGNIKTPLAIPTFRKAIRTKHNSAIGLRATAALALANSDPSCLYDLSILLFDDEREQGPYRNAPIRKAAGKAISVIGDPGGALALAIKLRFPQDEVAEVLADCIESLALLRPPFLEEILIPYLEGVNPDLATITALALAENLGVDALDILFESFNRVPRKARDSIVVAIASIRSNRTGKVLLEFLNDSDPSVRLAAVKGAALYLDDEIIEKLQAIVESDPDPAIRLAARLDKQ